MDGLRLKHWKWAWQAAWAVFCLLACVPGLWAQQEALKEYLDRPMLSVRANNAGIHGGWYFVDQSTSQYMEYPSGARGPGSYGDTRLQAASSQNREASRFMVRYGHGVWTLSGDGGVVYTGPRFDAQAEHIRAMQYDVSADPDLSKLGKEIHLQRRPTVKMGYGAGDADGVVETSLGGNWWPGSTLIEDERNAQAFSRQPIHINNFNLGEYQSFDEWPEEIIVTKWTTSQGLTFTERISGWSHPDFDDFFIDEYVIENTGDTDGDGERDLPEIPQSDLFVGFMDRISLSAAGQHYLYQYWWREHARGMDDWYQYDPSLKLLYTWDGDEPLVAPWDDTGDPYKDAFAAGTLAVGGKIGQTEDMLLSMAHVGVAPIAFTNQSGPHAFNARDQGYVDPEGDQPYALHYWEVFDTNVQEDPFLAVRTAASIHSEIVGTGRRFEPDTDHPSGQFSMMLFGPYDLGPGEKTKIVVAYLAGHPGQMLGNTDAFTWAQKGNQNELSRGLDAMKQNLEAAQFAYDNGFDIPDAPPDVNFRTGSNGVAQMTVDWPAEIERSAHPDFGSADIAGYRVYRSTWFDMGPWELVADIPAGTTGTEAPNYTVSREGGLYRFTDVRSAAGFFYHYSVRGYAKPHSTWSSGTSDAAMHPLSMADLPGHVISHVQVGQEGGYSASTQRTRADESPFAVPSTQTEAMAVKIRTVPNPFILDEAHAYPGSSKIRFVGIPSKCRIRVFTTSGDLASDVVHDASTKAEYDYTQDLWTQNGVIATGVYIWVVENLVPGPNFGQLQRGALMVIK